MQYIIFGGGLTTPPPPTPPAPPVPPPPPPKKKKKKKKTISEYLLDKWLLDVRMMWFLPSLFIYCWFHMWRLFCPSLFLISPSFGASRRLCPLIFTFPGYLYLYSFSLYFFCKPSLLPATAWRGKDETFSCFCAKRSKAYPLLQLFVRMTIIAKHFFFLFLLWDPHFNTKTYLYNFDPL